MRWACDSIPAELLSSIHHGNQCAIMERGWFTASRAPCRNFSSRGNCRFGNRCRFSHDISWRTSRPPPEMTPCFHWEESGACPLGDRCAYLHRPQVLEGVSLLHDNLHDEIYTFMLVKIQTPGKSVTLTNLQNITSYDWLTAERPTIGVPGTMK